jgi:hypothetical protein
MSETDERRRSAQQIEADIETTRKQLADTVEALAEKTDVKAQAKAKAEAASTKVRDDRTVQYAIAGALALGLATVLLKRRS